MKHIYKREPPLETPTGKPTRAHCYQCGQQRGAHADGAYWHRYRGTRYLYFLCAHCAKVLENRQ